jgi:hypothetical protein
MLILIQITEDMVFQSVASKTNFKRELKGNGKRVRLPFPFINRQNTNLLQTNWDVSSITSQVFSSH